MSIFERSVTRNFFFKNCTHILTRTYGDKFEDMFLVKIANKGTSLICFSYVRLSYLPWYVFHYQRQKRSHGHRHYNKRTPQLDSSIDIYVNLIDLINQPQGVINLKQRYSLFPSHNYVNYNHLPKNPQTLTMNLLSIELQPLF